MSAQTAALITVREALERLGWIPPDAPDSAVNGARGRLLRLCKARGIVVEQFQRGGTVWVSGPRLDHYIATLQAPERADG